MGTQTEPRRGDEPSQASYKESPYEDQAWEIVGQYLDSDEFVPEEFSVIPRVTPTTDPMFRDYGGLPAESSVRRHVPEKQQQSLSAQSAKPREEEDQIAKREHEAELDRVRAEAFAQGRESALEEATQKHTAEVQQLRDRIQQVLQDMNAQLVGSMQRIEHGSVELALAISRKIIESAVEINPEYIIAVVNEALGKCENSVIRRVRVSPEDMEFITLVGIERHLKDYDGTWKFESDPAVRSGCIVDTSAGDVDFQLDRAWERVRDKVVSVIR